MLTRSMVWGALIAAVFIGYQGIRGHLDIEAAAFGAVFGATYTALDYLRNRKQCHGHEADRARDGVADGRPPRT